MSEKNSEHFRRRFRFGKLLTLFLVLFGLVVTLLHTFAKVGTWVGWLTPFTVPSMAFAHWFDPALVFVPLAMLAVAAWVLLHFGQLYGREILIVTMLVYLFLNFFFVPFYSLIFSSAWDVTYLGYLLKHSISGYLYPILVLYALHLWNPRRI